MNATEVGVTGKQEAYWFNVAGTFFLLAQAVIFSAIIFDPETRLYVVWSCNNFCFFLAIACYLKNMQMVKGISYVGLVTQFLWAADFVSPYFGFNLSSISDYAAIGGFSYTNTVSVALHFIIPVIVLAISFRVHPERRSLLYSIPYILFLFFATLIFTSAAEDVNCVYLACHLDTYFPFSIPYYMWLWPLYAMVPTLLGYLIHEILYHGWHTVIKRKGLTVVQHRSIEKYLKSSLLIAAALLALVLASSFFKT